MISILSAKKAASLGLDDTANWAVIMPRIPAGFTMKADDQFYLDISGLTHEELKKTLARIKKRFAGFFWGIIDPKGEAEDPAVFFFEGASDYIGPRVVKNGPGKKRFAAAQSRFFRREGSGREVAGKSGKDIGKDTAAGNDPEKRKSQKLLSGKFRGWKSVCAGTASPFFFLLVYLSGEDSLRSMLGEKGFNSMKNRLRDLLQNELRETDALLWMETEETSLFLIPPHQANGKAVVEAGLKMILNSRIIGIEKLTLSFPVELTLSLHYGKTIFHAPGKTGSLVSEPVNYIFHLGKKKAEPGRLTISADVPEEAVPEGLLPLFNPAGEFEGIPVRHSRRFVYNRVVRNR